MEMGWVFWHQQAFPNKDQDLLTDIVASTCVIGETTVIFLGRLPRTVGPFSEVL